MAKWASQPWSSLPNWCGPVEGTTSLNTTRKGRRCARSHGRTGRQPPLSTRRASESRSEWFRGPPESEIAIRVVVVALHDTRLLHSRRRTLFVLAKRTAGIRPERRAASSTFSVPRALTSKSVIGSATEVVTATCAAKWTIASHPAAASTTWSISRTSSTHWSRAMPRSVQGTQNCARYPNARRLSKTTTCVAAGRKSTDKVRAEKPAPACYEHLHLGNPVHRASLGAAPVELHGHFSLSRTRREDPVIGWDFPAPRFRRASRRGTSHGNHRV